MGFRVLQGAQEVICFLECGRLWVNEPLCVGPEIWVSSKSLTVAPCPYYLNDLRIS